MEVLKKYVDTTVVLGGIFAGFLWMNGKFNDIDKRFYEMEAKFDVRFQSIENRLTIIETVLTLKDIMPGKFAYIDNLEKKVEDR
ncbi:hypothetical protein HC928_07835 [bacterium]|nr:hypothetical protein [bacterium]